jgi:phage terminase small subunit
MWADLWRYTQAWVSPGIDSTTVELACRAFDDVARARRLVERHGMLVEEPICSANGTVVGSRLVANPAVRMCREAERAVLEWLTKLAVPPVDRARMGLAQVKTQSKFEELVARRSAPRSSSDAGERVAVDVSSREVTE